MGGDPPLFCAALRPAEPFVGLDDGIERALIRRRREAAGVPILPA